MSVSRVDEPLTVAGFYAQTAQYMDNVDPTWYDERVQHAIDTEWRRLAANVGRGEGSTALDCSCGPGTQAIPLAEFGLQVAGIDATDAVLARARTRADRMSVAADWHVGDMRTLDASFRASSFDLVVSCMALDNILTDDGLRQALGAMHRVLKPTGRCYLRLRDFDHLLKVRPRYDLREERLLSTGRVIRLEDWIYESEQHAVNVWIFLLEDTRKDGYQWETAIFAYRRRVLRKAELEVLMYQAGFGRVRFLPQASPWDPFEVLAE